MAATSFLLSLLIAFLTQVSAQSPAAPYPSPPQPPLVQSPPLSPSLAPSPAPQPPSIITILQKYGSFTALIRLLKTTGMADQIDSQIKKANGLTFFAPNDAAFSKLKTGMLNSFSNEQQVELMQFHVIPAFLTTTQFQTVSNPLFTLADGANDGKFPLNITINGDEIDLSTGIDNATITNTLYSGNQLVVYQVDRVLLPRKIFMPNTPPPALAPVEAPPAVAVPKTTADGQPVTTVSSSASRVFSTMRMIVQCMTMVGITCCYFILDMI